MFARILGIDPGLTRCGYGLIMSGQRRDISIISNGILSTPKENTTTERIKEIHQDIDLLIREFKPDVIAIEKVFFQANVSTAISVAQVSGVVHSVASSLSIPVFEYTPTQIKNAVTGDGQADKIQIQTMVTRLLNLNQIPEPADAADALAVAITHSLFQQAPSEGNDSESAIYAGSKLHDAIANAITSQKKKKKKIVSNSVKKNIIRKAKPDREYELPKKREGITR